MSSYERALLHSYRRVFPPSSLTLTVSSGEPWSPSAAEGAVTNLLSAVIVDHALHRGERASRHLCIPHLVCDCVHPGSLHTLTGATRTALVQGRKLSQLQKSEIERLPLHARAAHVIAYVANRCQGTPYRRACALFFFQAEGGVGHANMLLIERQPHDGRLSVTCYEPNGSEAALRYQTQHRFFRNFEHTLQPLLAEPGPVKLSFVGLNLQTFVGEHRHQGRYLISRGYPVCEAVVLWFFSQYMRTASSSVEDFERRLLAEGRPRLRAALLDWVQTMEAWVQTSYAGALEAKLEEVFDQSNVTSVTVDYGDVRIEFSQLPVRRRHRGFAAWRRHGRAT